MNPMKVELRVEFGGLKYTVTSELENVFSDEFDSTIDALTARSVVSMQALRGSEVLS